VVVEQVGDEGKVELWISSNERSRCKEFAAIQPVRIL